MFNRVLIFSFRASWQLVMKRWPVGRRAAISGWRGCARPAVYRYVRAGVRGELGPRPVRVPALQLEPGELGHQVELSGPDVAVRRAEEPGRRAVAKPEVVRDDPLAQDIVGVNADVAGLRIAHRARLPRRELAQLRHPQLDHEAAAGPEVTRCVAKAGHLPGLSEQVGDRVVNEVDEREGAWGN